MARNQVKLLTAAENRAVLERLPRPVFRRVEQLDRVRCYMLALPIKKLQATTPWGYSVDEESNMLIPKEKSFELLVRAKTLLRNHSYVTISQWLTKETGDYISDGGLHKIMYYRMPDDRCLLPLEERMKI